VFGLIMREGLVATAIGLGLGGIGIVGLQRALQSQLFGVTAVDPVVLVAVTGLLACVAVTACAAPAWRASRIDPLVALSH
jgi:putative ABC transport system permease protein